MPILESVSVGWAWPGIRGLRPAPPDLTGTSASAEPQEQGHHVKASRIGQSAAILSIGAIALTACGGGSSTLQGAGASSQEAAMNAWSDTFQ